MYSVFIITNPYNSHKYIGVTKKNLEDIVSLFEMHLNNKYSNIENRSYIYLDMRKFGFECFRFKFLKSGLTKKHALQIEREFKRSDLSFEYYAVRDIKRNNASKFRSCYKLISEDEILYFKSTIEISKKFGCHKTNITRSLKDGYLFMKKYFIVRISESEYNKKTSQTPKLF